MQEKQVYEGFIFLSDNTAFRGLIEPSTVEEIQYMGWGNSADVSLIETEGYKIPQGIHDQTLFITDILLPLELQVDRPFYFDN